MKRVYLVAVSETYTAQIEVEADSPDEAEIMAEELVGGGDVDIVKLSLAGGSGTSYSKSCEVCTS